MTHLNDDQLIERLYGVEAHPHLDVCAECSARYAELERRRTEAARPAVVSPEFLMEQREAILARVERRTHWAWVPALAASAAIAVGLFVYRPVPAPHVESGDEQLFADVYSMAQSTEPRAASPIHSLFEDGQ